MATIPPQPKAVEGGYLLGALPEERLAHTVTCVPYVVGDLPVSHAYVRQRRMGKVLIPQATCKEDHLSLARQVSIHPAYEPPVLSAGVATAYRRMKLEGPDGFAKWQHNSKKLWVDLARDCKAQQQQLARGLPSHLRACANRLQSVALGRRLRQLGYKDAAVADGLASGYAIVGDLGPWGLWSENVPEKLPAKDISQLQHVMQERMPRILHALEHADQSDVEQIWAESTDQAYKGWLGEFRL